MKEYSVMKSFFVGSGRSERSEGDQTRPCLLPLEGAQAPSIHPKKQMLRGALSWAAAALVCGGLLLGAGVGTAWAQEEDDEDIPELNLWLGGDINLNLGLNFNLNGIGHASSRMGGVVSTRVDNGAASLYYNPAAMGMLRRHSVVIDGQVGYGTWSTAGLNQSILDELNTEIANESESLVNDPDIFNKQPDAFVQYSNVNSLRAGIPRNMSAMAIAWPVNRYLTLGVGYSRPLDVRFRLQTSGLTTKIAQEQGTDDVSVRFDVLMNISSLTNFTLGMSTVSAGFGSQVYEGSLGRLSVGANVQRYRLENNRLVNTDLSGMVVVGNADERFFNNVLDPNLNFEAGETNAFFLQARANMRDEQYGYKLGAAYASPRNRLNFSVNYQHIPEFNLSDENAFSSAFLPIFILSEDLLGGDFDVSLDTLQANKPNLTTERDISSLVAGARLQLPSSVQLGLDLGLGRSTLVLNYTQYLNNFEIEYDGDLYGYKPDFGVGFGINHVLRDELSWGSLFYLPLRVLFLDIDGLLFQSLRRYTRYSNPQYSLGATMMVGGPLDGAADSSLNDALDLPFLPTSFSMGRSYSIFDTITIGTNIIAVPDLMFRFSVGYDF